MDERAEERLELRWIERDDRDDAREHRETLVFWEDDGLSHFERVSVETDAWRAQTDAWTGAASSGVR